MLSAEQILCNNYSAEIDTFHALQHENFLFKLWVEVGRGAMTQANCVVIVQKYLTACKTQQIVLKYTDIEKHPLLMFSNHSHVFEVLWSNRDLFDKPQLIDVENKLKWMLVTWCNALQDSFIEFFINKGHHLNLPINYERSLDSIIFKRPNKTYYFNQALQSPEFIKWAILHYPRIRAHIICGVMQNDIDGVLNDQSILKCLSIYFLEQLLQYTPNFKHRQSIDDFIASADTLITLPEPNDTHDIDEIITNIEKGAYYLNVTPVDDVPTTFEMCLSDIPQDKKKRFLGAAEKGGANLFHISEQCISEENRDYITGYLLSQYEDAFRGAIQMLVYPMEYMHYLLKNAYIDKYQKAALDKNVEELFHKHAAQNELNAKEIYNHFYNRNKFCEFVLKSSVSYIALVFAWRNPILAYRGVQALGVLALALEPIYGTFSNYDNPGAPYMSYSECFGVSLFFTILGIYSNSVSIGVLSLRDYDSAHMRLLGLGLLGIPSLSLISYSLYNPNISTMDNIKSISSDVLIMQAVHTACWVVAARIGVQHFGNTLPPIIAGMVLPIVFSVNSTAVLGGLYAVAPLCSKVNTLIDTTARYNLEKSHGQYAIGILSIMSTTAAMYYTTQGWIRDAALYAAYVVIGTAGAYYRDDAKTSREMESTYKSQYPDAPVLALGM